jgi:hypothetical protein
MIISTNGEARSERNPHALGRQRGAPARHS